MDYSSNEARRVAREVIDQEDKMNREVIAEAREEYFRDHPFDPHEKALMAHDENGLPSGFLTLPDMGEMSVVAAKFGMEYLAICNDEEAIDDWIMRVTTTAGGPEMAGIMFANVFRGIDQILSTIIDRDPNFRQVLVNIAIQGWSKDFNDFKEDE